jgi:hypothetical protein
VKASLLVVTLDSHVKTPSVLDVQIRLTVVMVVVHRDQHVVVVCVARRETYVAAITVVPREAHVAVMVHVVLHIEDMLLSWCSPLYQISILESSLLFS